MTNNTMMTTITNDCGFYFMYRKKKRSKWIILFNRPFLMRITDNAIHGQFISSNWFRTRLDDDDDLDFVVLRLPRRDNTIHPDETFTSDLVLLRIQEVEENNEPISNIDFVVVHKTYTKQQLDILRTKLHDKLSEYDNYNTLNDFAVSYTHLRAHET